MGIAPSTNLSRRGKESEVEWQRERRRERTRRKNREKKGRRTRASFICGHTRQGLLYRKSRKIVVFRASRQTGGPAPRFLEVFLCQTQREMHASICCRSAVNLLPCTGTARRVVSSRLVSSRRRDAVPICFASRSFQSSLQHSRSPLNRFSSTLNPSSLWENPSSLAQETRHVLWCIDAYEISCKM